MDTNSTPPVSMIAAISSQKRALGNKNQLLWHLPGDLQHFKSLTVGHPIIMGSKTSASIGRALPGRTNIVLSTNPDCEAPGCTVVTTLEDAIAHARKENTEVFIIGGGQVYAAALPFATRLYLTLVDDEPEADTFFPDYSAFTKQVGEKEERTENGIHYTWVTLER